MVRIGVSGGLLFADGSVGGEGEGVGYGDGYVNVGSKREPIWRSRRFLLEPLSGCSGKGCPCVSGPSGLLLLLDMLTSRVLCKTMDIGLVHCLSTRDEGCE